MYPPTETANIAGSVAIGHIDDAASMDHVCQTLAAIHGAGYGFHVARWQGQSVLTAPPGRHNFYFVMEADAAHVHFTTDQRIRGIPTVGPYVPLAEPQWATVAAPIVEELWPGDVLCVNAQNSITLSGNMTCFVVESEASDYPLPAVAFLRHLSDRPGGCAAYPGAFRREALPPVRAGADQADQRGVNRVNEHTLDMRVDRHPQPQPHHHGPVAIGAGQVVNHSETALVLSRARYALPPLHGQPHTLEQGHVIIYPQPATDPTVRMRVPVRPGSVVVTPAISSSAATDAGDGVAGHCFEDAFAMLIAIPGFVSPHIAIND